RGQKPKKLSQWHSFIFGGKGFKGVLMFIYLCLQTKCFSTVIIFFGVANACWTKNKRRQDKNSL
ncbi:MAG: hypothetical protein KKB25_03275, partial [Nanoarchaeota archaeon]|nr:hypothetical protein [Nanoarchaeota archaeon]